MDPLTLEEQEKILAVAKGLIREPAHWTTGSWKCPVVDVNGHYVCDQNGQQLHQYCIEGAVNQAAIDVLGERRAAEFNAIPGGDAGDMTKELGLNDIAFELYAEEMGWTYLGENRYAMEFNDEQGQDDFELGHEGVQNILQTALGRVRQRLGKTEKANVA